MSDFDANKHLPRLEQGFYCGKAFVYWTYTIRNRCVGWLSPKFIINFVSYSPMPHLDTHLHVQFLH